MQAADIEANFADGKLELHDLTIEAGLGKFRGTLGYSFSDEKLTIPNLESSLDYAELVRMLDLELELPFDHLVFKSAPRISAKDFELDLGGALATGKGIFNFVAEDGFIITQGEDELDVSNLELDLSWDGSDVMKANRFSGRIADLEVFGEGSFRWAHDKDDQITADRAVNNENALDLDDVANVDSGEGKAVERAGEEVDEPGDQTAWVKLVDNLLDFRSKEGGFSKAAFNIVWDETLAEETKVAVAANFAGSEFEWNGEPVQAATFEASFIEGKLHCKKAQMRGLGGQIDATGTSYDFEDATLSVPKLESTINFGIIEKELEIDLGRQVDQILFEAPPRLNANNVEIQFEPVFMGRGKIEVFADEGFTVVEGPDELKFDRFDAVVTFGEPGLIKLEHAFGITGGLQLDVKGDVWFDEAVKEQSPTDNEQIPKPIGGSKEGVSEGDEIKAIIPQRVILPIIKEYIPEQRGDRPVSIAVGFFWDQRRSRKGTEWYDLCGANVNITGEAFAWHGLSVSRAMGELTLSEGVLEMKGVDFQTTDGNLETSGTYDLRNERIRLAPINLTMDPVTSLRKLGVPAEGIAGGNIRLLGRPEITSSSFVYDFDDPENSSGKLNVRCNGGAQLTSATGRNTVLNNLSGTVVIGEGTLSIEALKGGLLGGAAKVGYRTGWHTKTPWYSLSIDVTDISIKELNEWLQINEEDETDGSFDLQFNGRGIDSFDTLTGRGSLNALAEDSISEGMPVISDLIDFFERLVPILSTRKDWSADIPFTVADGRISVADGKVKTAILTVDLEGSYDWNADEIDVIAGADLRGIPGFVGVLISPFRSHLVRIGGTGSLGEIRWERVRN